MGYSITVNSNNFEVEVFQKSFQKPVLVDFFAVWCGPCQFLKPILEKLALEYDLILAKVNIDESPDLAHDYGVEGVPDVRLFSQGEIIDRFVGALPEPQLRQFLARHNITSELEQIWQSILAAQASGNQQEAEEKLKTLLEKYPENLSLTLRASKFLIETNRLDEAEKILDSLKEYEKEYFSTAQALKQLIALKRECNNPAFDNELDKLFSRAACLTVEGDYEKALEVFLDIVRQDRSYKNDGARKAMIAIFELLGNEHPLTKEYRKQLMMALY